MSHKRDNPTDIRGMTPEENRLRRERLSKRSTTHKCAARGCRMGVHEKLLMCRRHWYMLPQKMRTAVWTNYIQGQERHLDLVTGKYIEVVHEAINWIATNEAQIKEENKGHKSKEYLAKKYGAELRARGIEQLDALVEEKGW